MDTFTLTDYDEGGMMIGPDEDYRLVCRAESGAKIAIFGSAGNLKNIDAVRNTGLPCVIRCKTRTPPSYASERYGHTHWVSEHSTLKVVARPASKEQS